MLGGKKLDGATVLKENMVESMWGKKGGARAMREKDYSPSIWGGCRSSLDLKVKG